MHDKRCRHLVTRMVRMLKLHYDLVIFNHVDEIFVPDPAVHRDLWTYMDQLDMRGAAVAGMGIELLQDHAREPAFGPDLSIFAQRPTFIYEPFYAKPHIIATACDVGAWRFQALDAGCWIGICA